MPSDVLTPRETQVVKLVTGKFPGHFLEARVVSVHKLEGGEAATLRLTLDEASSTDLDRDRIAGGAEPIEELAEESARDLETQLRR